MIRELLAVGAGGALGCMARYALAYGTLAQHTLWGFPAGTFAVHTAGSLLIGRLIALLGNRTAAWILVVGFCGGFTTFSSFSADTVKLLRMGSYLPAALYTMLSVVGCIACTALGGWIGTLLKN